MAEVLRILNCGSGGLRAAIRELLGLIKESTGYDVVGLRMREGDDCPYYEQNGFSDDFLREENFLCAKGGDGSIVRDAEGLAILECTCGLVLSGRTDPELPFFTEGGSFWTNISSELLAIPIEDDPRTNPRNRCIHSGYQSIALIPVRSGEDTIGLLQLNDRREGLFTENMIHFYEGLADNIGLALERKRAEDALRESRADLLIAQEVGQIGSWRLDVRRNVLTWSDETYLIFGVPQGTPLTYDTFLATIHPDDRQYVDTRWNAGLRGEPYDIEHRIVVDEQVRWVREKAYLEFGDAGALLGGFGIVQDITERKQAEEALAQARAEAERRAAQMESSLASMWDGITLVDASGKVVLMNEYAHQLVGESPDNEIGGRVSQHRITRLDGSPLPPEQSASYRALHGESVRDLRYKLTRWDGREVVLSVNGSPVRDARGRIIGATTVFRDITDQTEFERQREELLQREHHIAEVLQQAIVPLEVPTEMLGYSIAVRSRPALLEADIGGDFYDVFDLGDGKLAVLIGDVAGKGLAAAIRVASARHAIRSYAYIDPRPARVMTLANETLCRDERDEFQMLTAFFAILDPEVGTITYTSAGHEPPLVGGAGDIWEELEVGGLPLGVFTGTSYEESSRRLDPGDIVVMVTDGITEARDLDRVQFGEEGVMGFVRRHRGESVEEIATGLLDVATAHAVGALQDDAAIVVFSPRARKADG